MPHDPRPVEVLRDRLAAALTRLHPSATLMDVPLEKLTRHAYELALRTDADETSPALPVEGWVAQTSGELEQVRTHRHYIVAEVDLGESSRWFPELLGMAARLRTHLGPDEQSDVTMLLIAQSGATAAGRASVLEHNEAFAKVLVWTPDSDARRWFAEADDFVTRLRLGPIEGQSEANGQDLSPVDAVFEGTNVSAEVRANWRNILMNTVITHAERARLLLESMDVTTGGSSGR